MKWGAASTGAGAGAVGVGAAASSPTAMTSGTTWKLSSATPPTAKAK